VTLTIVYDNNAFDPRLQAAWGFACLVEVGGRALLFDTGGDGPTLMANLAALGIDAGEVEVVVLSHVHGDHTGGLEALLAVNDRLVVYVPRSFSGDLGRQVGERALVVPVDEPVEIMGDVRTTGEMGTAVLEQSLIVETDRGLAVVTGCAHPGIVEIVRRAAAQGEVDLVIGGFHLHDRSPGDVQAIIEQLVRLGVRRVAPCHCTGAQATAAFDAAFGPDFVPCGVGAVITIEP
jgi:7,8-dihydropterin-6-yl-methyl-4-(beta-D-ribofuranosyl)aminobenzene 5'-phosphate synthase